MDALDTLPSASALMTRADAYRAMLHLIKYYYRFGDGYRIGAMLGDLSLGVWEDGMAGDSGVWELCSMLSPASFRNPIEHRRRTFRWRTVQKLDKVPDAYYFRGCARQVAQMSTSPNRPSDTLREPWLPTAYVAKHVKP